MVENQRKNLTDQIINHRAGIFFITKNQIVKKLTIIIALLIIFCPVIFAQVDKQHFNMNLEGQLVVTANEKALFINMGGPAI